MFKIPDSFEALPIAEPTAVAPSSWLQVARPTIENEEEKKQQFGTELAKGLTAFAAACVVCGNDTNKALWINQHWLNDPIVVAAKDIYLKTVDSAKTSLTADDFATKILTMADEKNQSNTFYLLEGKDRVSLLRLYAEIKGFVGKNAIDLSTKNFTYNQIAVKLIKPEEEKQPEKVIEQIPNELSPKVKLKLVS